MKTNMLTLASAAALTMSLALPAFAGTTALTDEALDAVSGKAVGNNISTIAGTDTTTISGSTLNGNVQVGYYQWTDDHNTDSSKNKGGNIQSGSASQVQQNGAALANTLAWGAVSQSVTNNAADIGNDQAMESWATMYIGGF
jgi:hypothetical protein